jgi:membrane-associated protease RseP (regulator of RpoE activity)
MRDPLDERFDARRTLVGVVVLVVGLVVLGLVRPAVLGTVGVIVGIFAMIMIHEAGHYVTAKWSDMKVTEFFLGFGPRLWSVRRGETEYGVKAIPAGGYVRIIGMNNLDEVDPEDEPRTYRAKPYRNRLMVAVAGSFTHFAMAVIGLFLILGVLGVPEARPIVNDTVEGLPAAGAGILPGDRIVGVDGAAVSEWADVPLAIRRHRPGDRVVLRVERDGLARDVDVVTAPNPEKADEALVGIRPEVVDATRPVPTAVGRAFTETGSIAWQSLTAIGRFFTPGNVSRYTDSLTGQTEPSDDTRFLSPVGATRVASSAVEEGLREVVFFLVLINIFVGVFNMLPVPPFDGGHVAIATYEKVASGIRGRRVQVDMAKIMPVAMLVVAVLLFIGLSALYLDIVRPVEVRF